jgi:hypothetical protein
MIAIAPTTRRLRVTQETAEVFVAMLPSIQRVASYAFRHLPRWRKRELIQDVMAKAYVAFVELVARGKAALAYPTVLAKYAIRQLRDGRQVGCRRSSRDVLSPFAQRKKGFIVERLNKATSRGRWEELVTEDRHATPADLAACRLDFSDWLKRLQRFKRQLALRLADGDTTTEAARRFKLSLGRVSQARRELRASWDEFQAMPLA